MPRSPLTTRSHLDIFIAPRLTLERAAATWSELTLWGEPVRDGCRGHRARPDSHLRTKSAESAGPGGAGGALGRGPWAGKGAPSTLGASCSQRTQVFWPRFPSSAWAEVPQEFRQWTSWWPTCISVGHSLPPCAPFPVSRLPFLSWNLRKCGAICRYLRGHRYVSCTEPARGMRPGPDPSRAAEPPLLTCSSSW